MSAKYFDEGFVNSLPDEPFAAILVICDAFFEAIKQKSYSEAQPIISSAYALIEVYADANGLDIKTPPIVIDEKENYTNAKKFFQSLYTSFFENAKTAEIQHSKETYAAMLGKQFHYEFSEGDLKKIQKLLDELRTLISDTKDLEEDHKQRLLRRLEKLQSELHKKVSDLDRFWGFFIDASIVIGTMGENTKPMVEVIKKIVGIIWPTQTRAYDLSSDLPFKLLGQPEEDES